MHAEAFRFGAFFVFLSAGVRVLEMKAIGRSTPFIH
jgi:hypothetical protein